MTTESLEKELENLSHTIIDVEAVFKCNEIMLEKIIPIQKNLGSRLEPLRTRIDRLTEELGRLKDEKDNLSDFSN